ncbi:MAG: hypothetical protein H7296_02135 [Bacteroidia bacterium]|nr:hypothetical protein [Bacteroidia bacterium]
MNYKNEILSSWHYRFLHDTLVIVTWRKNKNGDTLFKSINSYSNSMRIVIKDSFFNRMDHPKTYETHTYTDIGKISNDAFYGSKEKLFYRYEYDYFENGKKKETRYFNHKNKLKFKYAYRFDLKGEV